MIALPSRLFLVVSNVDPETEPESPRYGAPALVPESWWSGSVQTTRHWWVWRRASTGEIVAATRINVVGARALYAVAGPIEWLTEVATGRPDVMPAREAWRRRAEDTAPDGYASPRQIVRACRAWRCDVTERATQSDVDAGLAAAVGDPVQRDGVVRVLSVEGVLLPDPTVDALPWDLDADGNVVPLADAARRVRALHRPALGVPGLCGAGLWRALEDEPDRDGA